jgi:carbamoyltransferase
MLLVAPLLEHHRLPLTPEDRQTMTAADDLRQRVNIVRSTLPAITHVDYSARIQTLDPQRHGRFYRLLKAFEQLTACPVLANTSFNIRGEPIVCTPQDAFRCFLTTDMDVLVMEDFIIHKEQMKSPATRTDRQQYLAQFNLD